MDKPVFIDYETRICSEYLNTVADTVFDALGQAKTPVEARDFIAAIGEAPINGKSYLRGNASWLEATSATAASGVSFAPAGGISSTNVQAGMEELDTDKMPKTGGTFSGNVSMSGALDVNNITSIDANSASPALRVTQTGAGNVAVFEDSANPDSTPVVINGDGRLIAGYGVSKTLGGGSATVQAVLGMSSVRYSDTFGPWCEVARAYGSEAVPTPVPTSGGNIGSFIFSGYGNTAFRKGAEIVSYSDGAFTDTSSPAHIRFSTTPVGSTIPVERMRVGSVGGITVDYKENASGLRMYAYDGGAEITATTVGAGNLDINMFPTGGTGNVNIRTFRSTVTTGNISFDVSIGNSTASNHSLKGNNAQISTICSNNGNVEIGNTSGNPTRIKSGLTIDKTSVTAPAASDGNVFSGFYTPTIGLGANAASCAMVNSEPWSYIRVGNVVHVSGLISLTASVANTLTAATFSLPVASNLSSYSQLHGPVTPVGNAASVVSGSMVGDSATDVAKLEIKPSATTGQSYAVSFQYRVV